MKSISEIESFVDGVSTSSPQRKKRSRRGIGITKKTAMGLLAVLIAGTLIASAGILSYYGTVNTQANVTQSVLIDGQNYENPISHSFDINAGCMKIFKHKIKNTACVEAPIDITTTITGPGGPEGVHVRYICMDGWKTLTLENKDTSWNVVEDDYYAEFMYNPCCPTLDWELVGKFMPETEYVLIYYADQPDRFSNWGGAPALELATFTSDGDGSFSESGNVNLDGCLPKENDWNIGPDADYVASDGYEHGKGAKIWLIPSDIYNGIDSELTDWVPDEILFETDLIAYFDCDINPIPEYLYPYFEYEEYTSHSEMVPEILQPGQEICFFMLYYFDVDIIPGQYDIATKIIPTE